NRNKTLLIPVRDDDHRHHAVLIQPDHFDLHADQWVHPFGSWFDDMLLLYQRRGSGSTDGREIRRLTQARTVDGGALADERGADESLKERVRPIRSGLQLWVELASQVPGMILQLNDLDQAVVGREPRKDEPAPHERRTVLVVYLVAVAVPLVN